jgi:hypothetical protein
MITEDELFNGHEDEQFNLYYLQWDEWNSERETPEVRMAFSHPDDIIGSREYVTQLANELAGKTVLTVRVYGCKYLANVTDPQRARLWREYNEALDNGDGAAISRCQNLL